MTEIAFVPLRRLYVHSLNTRTEPPPADIELLAESIRTAGLMQNLMGYTDLAGGLANERDLQSFRVGIVAGGRRLRALQLLHGADSDELIPVQITGESSVAAEWAGAENTARAALNPADEVAAYLRMHRQGANAAQIARAFAVRERHVHGRLRLAVLPDQVLQALRMGDLTIDQAAALTTAPSDEAAIELLPRIISSAGGWNPLTPDRIRGVLNPQAVRMDDRRVIYAGVADYIAKGGRTQTDLFQDRQVLLDPDILDACFAEKLERDRLAELAEGWKAVVAFTESYPNHNAIDDAGRPIKRETIELPEADQQDLDRLRALDELTDEEQERLDDLEARRIGDYTDEDKAQATAFIYVDREGALIFYDARVPREKPQGGDDTGGTVANAETIPSSLRDDLRTVATLALQTALLDKTELVLDLLALCFDPDLPAWGRPLALGPAYQNITPQKPDETRIDARLQSVEGTGRGELTIDLLTDLQAGSKKDRNARITAALARTFNVANSDFGRALANMLQVNPRKVWHPTAENYFKRLPTGHLDGIWQDLCPMEAADRNRFAGLKKGEKAKLLEQLFHDTDYRERLGLSREENARIDAWLPPELAQGKGAAA